MMSLPNRVISFFLKNCPEPQDSIAFQKAKTLTATLLSAGILVLVLITKILITDGIRPALVPMTVLLVVLLMLAVIYKGKTVFAGNLLSVLFLALMIFSMYANPRGSEVPYYMVGQYYIFFVIIVFSAMFASKLVFSINSAAAFATSIHIFYATREQIPENVADISEYGFFVYLIMFALVALFSYVFTSFIDKSIFNLSKKSEKVEQQNKQMKALAAKVALGSKDLFSASSQLNIISQKLSQTTNEQAATTQEIASAVNKMLITIGSNADYANNTNEISTQSAKRLEENKTTLMKALQTVKSITDRISIISDIAFQTNILSLNASIQASRAGDNGKGFAVVAEEIRNLAERTKIASKDIENFAQENRLASRLTSQEMEAIIPLIITLSEHVEKIAQASEEQKRGAELVGNSIQNLVRAANLNSSSAEEMSASAEELSAQAEQLKKVSLLFES